jgi:hypothetical protein
MAERWEWPRATVGDQCKRLGADLRLDPPRTEKSSRGRGASQRHAGRV